MLHHDALGFPDTCRLLAEHLSALAVRPRSRSEASRRGRCRRLRPALRIWNELPARYEAARVRVLISLACRALGDGDTAVRGAAAGSVLEELGAIADQARVAGAAAPSTAIRTHGLTDRELEVLRLVAAGKTSREIAEAPAISEHAVARHIQNLFAKLWRPFEDRCLGVRVRALSMANEKSPLVATKVPTWFVLEKRLLRPYEPRRSVERGGCGRFERQTLFFVRLPPLVFASRIR